MKEEREVVLSAIPSIRDSQKEGTESLTGTWVFEWQREKTKGHGHEYYRI